MSKKPLHQSTHTLSIHKHQKPLKNSHILKNKQLNNQSSDSQLNNPLQKSLTQPLTFFRILSVKNDIDVTFGMISPCQLSELK